MALNDNQKKQFEDSEHRKICSLNPFNRIVHSKNPSNHILHMKNTIKQQMYQIVFSGNNNIFTTDSTYLSLLLTKLSYEQNIRILKCIWIEKKLN